MKESSDLLDDNSNPISLDSDYDATSELDEGYNLKRITFKSLISFVLSVLNFERGILFTVRELFIRPRVVVEEYLKKDRKKLINPIRFLVFSTALAAFLSLTLISNNPQFNSVRVNFDEGFNQGVEMAEIEKLKNSDSLLMDSIKVPLNHADSIKINEKKIAKKKMMNFGKLVQDLTTKNSDKFTFILVLFFSFFTFIFFKRNGYNLTENLVINCYMTSLNNVFTIVFFLPAILTENLMYTIIASLLGLTYTIYFWVSVYNRKSFGGVMRSILVYLVSYLTFLLVMGIIAAVYIGIILLT